MVKVGVVGYGNIGSFNASNIANKVENASLVAVCDLKEDRLQAAKESYPGITTFTDYQDMIQSGEVDAVYIAVPHYLHPSMAMAAMECNLHVLLEKPAGVYTAKVQQMNELAKSKPELVFSLMLNQRTNPLYERAKALIEQGELGAIKRTNWVITDWYRSQAYYDSGEWRASWKGEGGGVLINQCPHQIDLLQWLGGMPAKVHSFCKFGKNRNVEVETDVTAYLEYKDGGSGIFVASIHDAPGTNRFEISGDKGQIVIEHGKLTFKKLALSETEHNRTTTEKMEPPAFEEQVFELDFVSGNDNEHVNILNNWANTILGKEQLVAPGVEGINGLELTNAIYLSTFVGETIELPLDEQRYHRELMKRVETSSYTGAFVE